MPITLRDYFRHQKQERPDRSHYHSFSEFAESTTSSSSTTRKKGVGHASSRSAGATVPTSEQIEELAHERADKLMNTGIEKMSKEERRHLSKEERHALANHDTNSLFHAECTKIARETALGLSKDQIDHLTDEQVRQFPARGIRTLVKRKRCSASRVAELTYFLCRRPPKIGKARGDPHLRNTTQGLKELVRGIDELRKEGKRYQPLMAQEKLKALAQGIGKLETPECRESLRTVISYAKSLGVGRYWLDYLLKNIEQSKLKQVLFTRDFAHTEQNLEPAIRWYVEKYLDTELKGVQNAGQLMELAADLTSAMEHEDLSKVATRIAELMKAEDRSLGFQHLKKAFQTLPISLLQPLLLELQSHVLHEIAIAEPPLNARLRLIFEVAFKYRQDAALAAALQHPEPDSDGYEFHFDGNLLTKCDLTYRLELANKQEGGAEESRRYYRREPKVTESLTTTIVERWPIQEVKDYERCIGEEDDVKLTNLLKSLLEKAIRTPDIQLRPYQEIHQEIEESRKNQDRRSYELCVLERLLYLQKHTETDLYTQKLTELRTQVDDFLCLHEEETDLASHVRKAEIYIISLLPLDQQKAYWNLGLYGQTHPEGPIVHRGPYRSQEEMITLYEAALQQKISTLSLFLSRATVQELGATVMAAKAIMDLRNKLEEPGYSKGAEKTNIPFPIPYSSLFPSTNIPSFSSVEDLRRLIAPAASPHLESSALAEIDHELLELLLNDFELANNPELKATEYREIIEALRPINGQVKKLKQIISTSEHLPNSDRSRFRLTGLVKLLTTKHPVTPLLPLLEKLLQIPEKDRPLSAKSLSEEVNSLTTNEHAELINKIL